MPFLSQPARLRLFLADHWFSLIAVGVGLLAYGGMAGLHVRYGTLRDGYTPYTLGWYSLAFIAYLAALLGTERRAGLPLTIIFGGAIAFRLLLLLTTPTLSDDVYRYMWDGYVANNGVSPYAHPIDSPALDYLDTPQRALANNRWMASPYLPAAQTLFAALTWASPTNPRLFQLTMLGLDILNGLLLVKLLRLAALPDYRALLYLWNPLIIVESGHGAHVDTWMIFLVLAALWLTFAPQSPPLFHYLGSSKKINLQVRIAYCVLRIQKLYVIRNTQYVWKNLNLGSLLSPLALALGTLTKGLPVLLTAILFWRWRRGQLILYGLVVVGLVIPAGLHAGWGLSGPLDGTGLFGAIRIYADQWNFNSGLFHWLEQTLLDRGVSEPARWARRLTGLLMLGTMLIIWLRARQTQTPRAALRLMAVPLMVYILLTPTVHPWYLMMLLAFLPFLAPAPAESARRWLATAPWLYLSWALSLSYLTYLDPHDFRELEWVRRAEWWGAWGLLIGMLIFFLIVRHQQAVHEG